MVLNGEDKLECDVHVDGMRLEHLSDFAYLGCVLDELNADNTDCHRKIVSGREVTGAIRSPVKSRSRQLQCTWVLH